MLRELVRVKDVNTVMYSLDPTQFISLPRIWYELELEETCACANKTPRQQYLWTWCQSVVPNDFPRDFGPWVAFVELRFRYLSSPTGREGEISRPLDHMRQIPFIQLVSQIVPISIYIEQFSKYFLHVVRSGVY